MMRGGKRHPVPEFSVPNSDAEQLKTEVSDQKTCMSGVAPNALGSVGKITALSAYTPLQPLTIDRIRWRAKRRVVPAPLKTEPRRSRKKALKRLSNDEKWVRLRAT